MLPLYVIGHLNPDIDAICSAIGHAAYLQTGGEADATAARCGELTERAAWVLDKAGVEAPPLVNDVRATAGMICRRDVIQVGEGDTFLAAYQRMLASGVRSVPVVDPGGKVAGILRYLDLLELLVPGDGSGLAARTIHASLGSIADTLHAESVGAPLSPAHDEEDVLVLVGASSEGTVERRLSNAEREGNIDRYLVVCGDRPAIHRQAIERGARGLLVTGGYGIEPQLRELARQRGVVVLLGAQDTATSTTLIRCSRTVRHVMERRFESLAGNEPVSQLRKRLVNVGQDLFPVTDPSTGDLVGVLSKSDLVDPPRTRLVLVDHNEFAQAVRGVEEARIIEVIDHHRLAGDLVSREPIRYLNEPVGSTSTLVARKFRHRALVPDQGVALCLCAGIISDTLCLKSPTTTPLDHEMLEWLSGIAGIDPAAFTSELFAIGSLLASGDCRDILNADRKEFDDEGTRMTVAQVEELGLGAFESRQAELQAALETLAAEDNYDLAVLAVTDIAAHHSYLLAAGDPRLVEALPFSRRDGGSFDAPGVVSRKKQIFPALCSAVRRARG